MAVVTVDDRVLARWPAEGELAWRPAPAEGAVPRTVTDREDEAHLIGAPAVLDGECSRGSTARTRRRRATSSARAVELRRAARGDGAAARERTALEVESRLRGGLLDDLFGEAAVPDLVRRRALAFGYDLGVASRVFLRRAQRPDVAGGPTPADPEALHAPVADCAAGGAPRTSSPCAAARSRGRARDRRPSAGEDARRFEDELRASLSRRLPGVR